ncbi:MAG: leucine-rich repeat protein, partial [Lachnospiraceae bacterium]|nr:leucine-rich repeat protein [Lachnospiraceae bacterium]
MKRTKRYLALLLALLLLVPTSLQAAESQTAESSLEDAVESVTATDVLSTTRTAALNQLASAYASYSESEYTAEAWTLLTEEYGYGQDNIEGAQSYDAIMTALANAKTAMAAVEKSGTVQVAVTIEKLSIDGTYIIEPTLLTVEKKEQASIVITDLLKAYYTDEGTITNGTNGNPYRMTGTESGSFYLAGVYDPTYDPTVLTYNTDGEAFSQEYEGFLSEFDGGRWSGWMYCVNGSFPGVGASNWYMNNGDVMRWQYTCTGLGADIGADSSDWGEEYGSGETTAVADKDDLIWRVAEINEAAGDDRESYLSSQSLTETYAAAMTVLTNLTASQTEVDEALKALGDTNEDRDSLVLESARTTALTTLRNYAQAEDYSEENQELLAQYISEGSAAIYAAASESEVETALAEAEALIDALKTLAQEAAAATTTATEAPTTTAAEETTTTKADETTTTAATAAKGDTVTSGSVKYTVTASGQVTATKVTSKTVTSVKIPSTVSVGGTSCKVTAIAEGAFSGCTKLTGVTIGANVKTIGAKAFYGCTALKKVSGCAAVTSVGKQAFSGCTKLTTVEGLTRTTSIGSKAFYQCKKLTTVGSKSG